MLEDELDALLISKGYVFTSFDEFENLMDKCPFIIRKRCTDYGSKYYKYTITSLSLRSWIVYLPQSN